MSLRSNVSNAHTRTELRTHRTEVEKRGASDFFNESSSCLEIWTNTSVSVWYCFSKKNVLQEKTNEKEFIQVFDHISKTHHASNFPLFYLRELFKMSLWSKKKGSHTFPRPWTCITLYKDWWHLFPFCFYGNWQTVNSILYFLIQSDYWEKKILKLISLLIYTVLLIPDI